MTKQVFPILFFILTANVNAEVLSFPSFRIEVPSGWEQIIEGGAHSSNASVISLRPPSGAGILRMRSHEAPGVVSKDRLRTLTNVEPSVPLMWGDWGDYSGYQHSYTENGVYHRQWWLISGRVILLIVYEADPRSSDVETEAIENIVQSITANTQAR